MLWVIDKLVTAVNDNNDSFGSFKIYETKIKIKIETQNQIKEFKVLNKLKSSFYSSTWL